MKIAVLGTGMVGRRLATKLASLGDDVTMGSRSRDNADARQWAAETGGRHGTFAEAAQAGDLVVDATAGLARVPTPRCRGQLVFRPINFPLWISPSVDAPTKRGGGFLDVIHSRFATVFEDQGLPAR